MPEGHLVSPCATLIMDQRSGTVANFTEHGCKRKCNPNLIKCTDLMVQKRPGNHPKPFKLNFKVKICNFQIAPSVPFGITMTSMEEDPGGKPY